ncbi:MAG: hypothetical protein AABX84_00735 [Nanoarchaeota archaeon]
MHKAYKIRKFCIMELTIGQLIKIILGLVVIVVVIFGLIKFGGFVVDFIKNVVPGNVSR